MPIGILHDRLSITSGIAGACNSTDHTISRGRGVRIGIGDARLTQIGIGRAGSRLGAIRDRIGRWTR